MSYGSLSLSVFQLLGGFCVAQVCMPVPLPPLFSTNAEKDNTPAGKSYRFYKSIVRAAQPPESASMEEDLQRWLKEYPWRMMVGTSVLLVLGGTLAVAGGVGNLFLRGDQGTQHYIEIKKWVHQKLID